MLPVILLGLVLVLAALGLIGVLLFFEVAFSGAADTDEAATWRPPFLQGVPLQHWAATVTMRLVNNRLAGQRTGQILVKLAREVEECAMRAMLPLAKPSELARIVPCPDGIERSLTLTVPEVLAIAACLRRDQSREEQMRIHDLAAANSKTISSGSQDSSAPPAWACPLRGKDHVCSAYSVRPLQCRARQAMSMDGRRRVVFPDATAAPNGVGHEQAVAEGVEIGLARAIETAGVDANHYELNRALAKALEMPDPATSWGDGKKAF